MASARYAIYLAPPPDTPLWRFGSEVLGYDAITGEDLYGYAPEGMDPIAWRAIAERPRSYGFHATLKAPFRLGEGLSLADLKEDLRIFCQGRPSFDLGPLAVNALADGSGKGFAAMTPMRPSPELAALERDVVRHFDRFRAPLTAAEIAGRQPDRLTERQRESLSQFGYPFIGEDYRFHMTLTGSVLNVAAIADALADSMANILGSAHLKVDALVLFEQPSAGERFRVIDRFPLA
jgi:2'-5' RNA ligase